MEFGLSRHPSLHDNVWKLFIYSTDRPLVILGKLMAAIYNLSLNLRINYIAKYLEMKKESINVRWKEGMFFEAKVDGFKVAIDADPEFGGRSKGPKPNPLMMVALAGCTGMDTVSLLNKMRVNYESLNIVVEGELTEEHPKHFTKMKVIYELKGENIDIKKVQKAVELSKEKYCGVSYSYKRVMDLEYEIRILD